MTDFLPVGKLPPELLLRLLTGAPIDDPQVVLGPGLGLDVAVVAPGGPEAPYLVFKSDPITFATEEIGWYAVQVNANDIATSGATPRWFLMTLLLPEGRTDQALVEGIAAQVHAACREIGVAVIGGHTEVTYGLDRPLLIGTLVGVVEPGRLVTPRGARPGDRLLLTKGVPIEATAILAREAPDRLAPHLTPAELAQARHFLHQPGISVLRDAQITLAAGPVHAMHDPTEGGLAGALWELAEASGCALHVDPAAVPIPPLSRRICQALGLDPLAAIASGALLMAAPPESAPAICAALHIENITCTEIGRVEAGPPGVWQPGGALPRPARDEIARLFES